MAVSPKRRRAILAAHDGVCHYCGRPDAKHVDHIIPRADSGTDDLGNLIAACLPCNLYKRRHRLPPAFEVRALEAAENMRRKVLEAERGPRSNPIEHPTLLPAFGRAVRAGLNWTARDLAERAGVSVNTVSSFESGNPVSARTIAAIKQAMEDGGGEFGPNYIGIKGEYVWFTELARLP